MNLLKQLWNWFTTPNTDDCCDAEVCEEATPVEVEEEPEQDIAELFESVCAQLGLGDKFTKGLGATQKFVDWYGRKKQWLENGVAKRKTISRFSKLNV